VIRWPFIFPVIAASIHIIEEFAFPGGFRRWYIGYRPEMEKHLTTRRLIAINLILLAACASCAVTGPRHGGITTWLIVVSIVAWNTVFHILGALRTADPQILTRYGVRNSFVSATGLRWILRISAAWRRNSSLIHYVLCDWHSLPLVCRERSRLQVGQEKPEITRLKTRQS